MEGQTITRKNHQLNFEGQGSEYFGIIIVNWLLTIVTLGFYYPWAKAKKLQYLYGKTTLNNEPFTFHGTGKELFKGFIKAIVLFGLLYGLLIAFIVMKMPIIAVLVFYLGLLAIIPIAIHGAYRYRMSRTSWRGIRFGYRGNRKEFALNFFQWVLLTILTLGIYGAWMTTNVRKYVLGHVKFGPIEFEYDADGGDFFILNLKGYFLSIFTLGIYMFWWQKDLFEFYVNHLRLQKDNETIRLNSTATGGGFFKLIMTNLLLIIFTLGFGYAWAVTRTFKYIYSVIEIEGDIDLNQLEQTEDDYRDATGDDMSDILDLDFVM